MSERDQSDAEFLEGGHHFRFRASPPQRVSALNSSDRLDGVCATDGFHACFAKAEVPDLAVLNQILYGTRHVFDRRLRIDTVLVEDAVDGVGLT